LDTDVKNLLQLLRGIDLGVMEYWSGGVLKREYLTCGHYSNTPSLQYSGMVRYGAYG
jgi:hypothetical protein